MTFAGVKLPLRKRFGIRVKELRQATGLSQEAFADRCGFARSYMSRIERGGANPSLDAVEALADALGVEVRVLFETSAAANDSTGVIEVPYAADGTCFNPSLLRPRAKTYAVGEKSDTLRFDTFEAALAHLKTMTPAKWWRPNEKGDWGVVTAVRWAPLPAQTSAPTPQPSDDGST
ncbi:MAG TPA: helix-turn-helix transcriptional regulator [Aromatoleum sp.]|uniref:helix-turn-helix domain-containing protein n=1 Tax=Aromatoleum sp. TaxID=2307007 RepID=UPI002B49AAC9|nr:helix-turn-helix transcriptional regulator [Aromatoleum sp.]HJV26724.1 helix-turn-helix transcriptional regulator [Aromatoleum sp.]